MPSHAPDPLSIHTHTNVHALAHPHTHTRVRGKSIHSSQPAAPPFTWCPIMNGPWVQPWKPGPTKYDTHSLAHIHTHSNPLLENAFGICSSCLPHLLKLSDCAFVRRRGRVPHYGGHCVCASFRRSWGGKPTHCGIE